MKKPLAKILTQWIPSKRYRRAVRRALCEVPDKESFTKPPYKVNGCSTYNTLVIPRGFGHSGSGVIGDLLDEYEDTTVFSAADPDGSGRYAGYGKTNLTSFEIDLLKMRGGVIDLATAFGDSRAWGKFKLLEFIHLAEFLYRQKDIPIYDDNFLRRTREFIEELIEAKWISSTPMLESLPFEMQSAPPDLRTNMLNPLYGWRENLAESYVLKNISVAEYEIIASRYIRDILSSISSKRILVLDQLLAADLPPEQFERYVGPFKLIPVYRDPRDVYCTGAAHQMPWIPNEPRAFVKWYASLGIDRLLNCNHPSVLMFRFEDLVKNYEARKTEIENFIGLTPEQHIRPRTGFDPAKSEKNIGLYRKWHDKDAIKIIEKSLPEYCFE